MPLGCIWSLSTSGLLLPSLSQVQVMGTTDQLSVTVRGGEFCLRIEVSSWVDWAFLSL